jgi:hypothetical protein
MFFISDPQHLGCSYCLLFILSNAINVVRSLINLGYFACSFNTWVCLIASQSVDCQSEVSSMNQLDNYLITYYMIIDI